MLTIHQYPLSHSLLLTAIEGLSMMLPAFEPFLCRSLMFIHKSYEYLLDIWRKPAIWLEKNFVSQDFK
jgi:hypothetical protein